MSGYIDSYKMDFSPSMAALDYKLKDRENRRTQGLKAIRDMAGLLSRAAVVAKLEADEANAGTSDEPIGEVIEMPTTTAKDIYVAHNRAQAAMDGYRPLPTLAGYGDYMDTEGELGQTQEMSTTMARDKYGAQYSAPSMARAALDGYYTTRYPSIVPDEYGAYMQGRRIK